MPPAVSRAPAVVGFAFALAARLVALAEPAAAQPLFADGFEDADLCTWSARSPVYAEAFSLPDGSAWPAPWAIAGGIVVADVQAGRARLRSVDSSIAPGRLVAPVPTRDVEARFRFVMDDVSGQGVGFYVRQNGGWLQQTNPGGEGYSVFVEGFTGVSRIGIWRERTGIEEPISARVPTPFVFLDGLAYRARFRVNQMTPTQTFLQAKVWPDGDPEPAAWNITAVDDLASLQNVTAGIAVDLFNLTGTSAHGHVDDVELEELCNPLAQRGPLDTIGDGFIFSEGPLWRGDHLLFTDIGNVGAPMTAAIWRFTPPSDFAIERAPSNYANGLGNAIGGNPSSALLACEQGARRVSTTDAGGVVTTLVDNYLGDAFNAPNDIAARADGTLFFTDPTYGVPTHGGDREIPFNGLYRRTPAGALSAEWEGDETANQPNGVALSPDERTLYVTDTQAGALLAWNVAADGALSNQRVVGSGIDTPDGLCVDRRGNVYVATWGQAVQVYAPDGARFGAIPLARDATNCAFGGTDARTLYITAHDLVYAVALIRPGIP